MNPLLNLVYLGDSAIMVPAALALMLWLALTASWRTALFWCLLFLLGLGIVTISKMAFLGWAIGMPSIDLKGFSGHAMRTTAVMPVLLYFLTLQRHALLRRFAVMCGLASGIGMGVLLVAFRFHSVSETVGGCLLGGAIGLGFLRCARTDIAQRKRLWILLCGLVFFSVAWRIDPPPLQRWMVQATSAISGSEIPYSRKIP